MAKKKKAKPVEQKVTAEEKIIDVKKPRPRILPFWMRQFYFSGR